MHSTPYTLHTTPPGLQPIMSAFGEECMPPPHHTHTSGIASTHEYNSCSKHVHIARNHIHNIHTTCKSHENTCTTLYVTARIRAKPHTYHVQIIRKHVYNTVCHGENPCETTYIPRANHTETRVQHCMSRGTTRNACAMRTHVYDTCTSLILES